MRSPSTTRSSASPQRSALSVSSLALTFPDAAAGQPRFQVLTLAQWHADTPVTLTTDAPDHFQLASDAHPRFAPSLTLTPPPGGTPVHVRYLAAEPGRHVGQLLIQTPYDTQAVTLRARSGGLARRLLPDPSRRILTPVGQSGLPLRRPWAGVLAAVLLGGLVLAGYANRCRLAPGLCETTPVANPTKPALLKAAAAAAPAAPVALSNEPANAPGKSANTKSRTWRKSRSRRAPETAEAADPGEPTRLAGSLAGVEEPGRVQAADRNSERRDARPARRSRNRRPAPEAAPAEISDLERALNRTPND